MQYQCIKEWEAQWDAIVREIVKTGTAQTEDCKWNVLIDNLTDQHDSDSTFNSEIICAMLNERDEVVFAEQMNGEFVISFKPECCTVYKNIDMESQQNATQQMGGMTF